jgi:DNA-binding PadR family transcriptional regulator
MRPRLERDSPSLTVAAYQILLALGPDAKHGYAIMQDLAARSGGRLRLLPGTLYSTIKKLLADGLVEECEPSRGTESTDARRRYYRVTKTGKQAVQAETARAALFVRLARVFD